MCMMSLNFSLLLSLGAGQKVEFEARPGDADFLASWCKQNEIPFPLLDFSIGLHLNSWVILEPGQ